jgi:hypothetical protein
VALNKKRTAVRNVFLWRSVDSILPTKVDRKEIKKLERKYAFELSVKLYPDFKIKEDFVSHPHFYEVYFM